jgi:starvation-inducible outer membrane lipoprotein
VRHNPQGELGKEATGTLLNYFYNFLQALNYFKIPRYLTFCGPLKSACDDKVDLFHCVRQAL